VKPVAFEYDAPRELGEALECLSRGDDAKVLAGGQSLVPMLNFRLVRPSRLIDVNKVGGLGEIRSVDGTLHVGALARTAALERSAVVATGWPLLREAAGYVGHAVIRNRGTLGGSVAHSDPHAELPAVLCALDALLHVRSKRGARVLTTDAFFQDFYTTALEPDELLVEIEVPAMKARTGTGFCEHSRTHGDFAMAGAAVTVTTDANGNATHVAIALLGAGATPMRLPDVEKMLVGEKIAERAAHAAGAAAAKACDPPEPEDYRRALVAEMTKRALLSAASRVKP
jgi:CO/xanthine dehydrogenase FAD-binding subunit